MTPFERLASEYAQKASAGEQPPPRFCVTAEEFEQLKGIATFVDTTHAPLLRDGGTMRLFGIPVVIAEVKP